MKPRLGSFLAALLVLLVLVTLSLAFNSPNNASNSQGVRKPVLLARSHTSGQAKTLTFADRVAYQRATEEVYWQHRIWPKANAGPSPSGTCTETVINTNDSGPGSLRQALADAQNGDTICFNIPGGPATITLTSGELVIDNSITINGPGPDIVTVSRGNGAPAFRIFHFLTGHTVTIQGLTITHGSADNGGGIYNDHAYLTVTNCLITANSAVGASGNGGGIDSNGEGGAATLTVNNCTLSNNSADVDGGGIDNYVPGAGTATLTVNDSTLSGNSANGGGAIFNYAYSATAYVTINHCTLSGNSSIGEGGSALSNTGSRGNTTIMINNSTISGNSHRGTGAIYSGGSSGLVGTQVLTINNSTLSNNTATQTTGGAIYYYGNAFASATLTINNSTLSGNSAAGGPGGGIYNYCDTGSDFVMISNSTFSGNSAGPGFQGGAIYNQKLGSGNPVLDIGNTILKAGVGGNILNDGGTLASYGYNLTSDMGVTNINGGTGAFNATGDQINTEPLLGPLQNNGGPTLTHALQPGSLAIDRGKDNPGGPPTGQDQRGFTRPVVHGGITPPPGGDYSDIGAFEVQAAPPTPTPTATATPTPTCTPGPFRVLIVYADTRPLHLISEIRAEPGVTIVDIFNGNTGTPTLWQLQQSNIVVPYCTTFPFADDITFGNNLADYVDGGGIVVQYGLSFFSFPHYGINGRWVTGNYNPYNYSGDLVNTPFTLGSHNAGHPLMAGVTTLNSNYQNVVTLASGATQVAAASNNNSLVAFRPVGSHTTVGVTAYVGDGAMQSGHWGRVIVNAGRWLLGPCPSPTPIATPIPTPSATPRFTPRPPPTPAPRRSPATPTPTATGTPSPTPTPSATPRFTPRPPPTPHPAR